VLPDDYLMITVGTLRNKPKDQYLGKTFYKQMQEEAPGTDPQQPEVVEEEYQFTKADKDNRQSILNLFLHDPFEDIKSAKKRADFYRDLSLMIDNSMIGDLVRQQAAITIVKSYDQLHTIERTIERLMEDPIGNGDSIEQLNKMKAEQTRTISTYCKDNGFSEKYAANKSKGAQTLTGQMREMEEMGYDAEKVNLYDIKTSQSIQQIADISAQAIAKQLALGDADYVPMIQEQADYIKRLEKINAELEEKNRLLRATQVKQELILALRKELQQKGIPTEEIDLILDKEYNIVPGGYINKDTEDNTGTE
jgi:hypothetical protein